MVKELPLSVDDSDMCGLSVCMDPTNEDSTHIKQKIRILDHARLAIVQGLTGENITTRPNHYRLTQNLPRWGSAMYF